ncbi:MAG: UbiA family prenyltransferase [Bacteroidales bacterium]|nr:UbiA family prenyltransferase [Bacteroidales bacterium]
MIPYLQIIRWKNLVFLALIQWLMQFTVVLPLLQTFGFEIPKNNFLFWLLLLSTLLMTAGGYVINDYFDVKIDRINKPEKVIVGDAISTKSAMLFYQILTATGTIIGLVVAFLAKSFTLGFIFVVTPGLLWFYSTSYKRQFLIGNLTVSLLASLSIFIVAILAVAQQKTAYGALLSETPIPSTIYSWVGGFASFSFLLTWIREIIKDMEDIHGDSEMECRTMPIKWGLSKTKLFLYALISLTIILLLYVVLEHINFEGNFTFRYLLFGLLLPLISLAIIIYQANKKEDFHKASTFSKFIMLIGVLYSLVFYYLLAKKFGISLFGLFIIK